MSKRKVFSAEQILMRIRDELLTREISFFLKKAQILIERWRRHYNNIKSDSVQGYRPPAPDAIVVQPAPAGLTVRVERKIKAVHGGKYELLPDMSW